VKRHDLNTPARDGNRSIPARRRLQAAA